MAKKKKSAPEPQSAVEQIVATVLLCGHVNKQYYNPKGELEDLFCTLDKGHKGDHTAVYPGGLAAWSDAAGKSARKHA